ncbi:MAG: hypothetical protein Q9163_000888 [Psora crenata]
MLPLLARANDLLPYFLIRQTLKFDELDGRLSVRFGHEPASIVKSHLPADVDMADDGVSIISTVLSWDNSILKKRATAIQQDKRSPSKAQLDPIKAYCQKSREEQQLIRRFSDQEGRSIVACILSQENDPGNLAEEQHTAALEYLAIQASIRDRDELIRILCHNQPDLLTSSVRALVAAYEPIIRALHRAVDLSSGVSDLQEFLTALISLAKVDKRTQQAKPPSIEDFCRLLSKYQGSSHRFIHQVLKNGPELSHWYLEYAARAIAQYKRKSQELQSMTAAGNFTPNLQVMYSALSREEKLKVATELDNHAEYLASLSASSTDAMRGIIANLAEGVSLQANGPGIYLAKWQSLMDETPITPQTMVGMVRSGRSPSVKDATQVDIDGAKKGAMAVEKGKVSRPPYPDVSETVRLLIPGFRESLAKMNKP